MSQIRNITSQHILALLTLLAVTVVSARAVAGVRAKPSNKQLRGLSALFSAHHELPSKATFLSVDEDARSHLQWMAQDPNLDPWFRSRALAALAYWVDDSLWSTYATVFETEAGRRATSKPSALAHQCLQIMAAVFPLRTARILPRYIHHPDGALRLTAAHAFVATMKSLSVKERNDRYRALFREGDPAVRAFLGRKLRARAAQHSASK